MNLCPLDRSTRVLLVAPHPDDESLVAGALLQEAVESGAAVRVLFLTNGDNNPWPQRILERRWRIGDAEKSRWGARRQREALAALSVLGVAPGDVTFLGYPDQGLTDLFLRRDERLAVQLFEEIGAWRPTLLIAPSLGDAHPDHSAAALFVGQALARGDAASTRPQWLAYSVHVRGAADSVGEGSEAVAREAVIAPGLREARRVTKRAAVRCHESQVALQSWRFLRIADRPERFIQVPEPCRAFSGNHPIRCVRVEGGELVVRLSTSAWAAAFGRAMLCLAADRAGRPGVRAMIVVPRFSRGGTVVVRDAATGQPIGQAALAGGPRRAVVRLGLEMLGTMDRLYGKIERPYGFFDEAGWREVPLVG